jgi:ATP-binding cassette subfamily C (CFTR/MRP) protein 1
MMLLQVLPIIAASFACLRRIRAFLIREGRVDGRLFEPEDDNNEKTEKLDPNQGAFVTVRDGSFGWTEKTQS